MPTEAKKYDLVIVIDQDNINDNSFQNRYKDLIKDRKPASFGDGTTEITYEEKKCLIIGDGKTKITYEEKKCLIIGDGKTKITPDSLGKRLKDVEATNAIFTSHGSAQRYGKGKYDEYSKQSLIDQLCKITSKNIHVFGCHSGAAELPKDTPNAKRLICHSSKKYTTFASISDDIIKSLTEFYLEGKKGALKNLLLEPETIYIKKKDKTFEKLTAPKTGLSKGGVVTHLQRECPIFCVNLIFSKFCLNNFIKN